MSHTLISLLEPDKIKQYRASPSAQWHIAQDRVERMPKPSSREYSFAGAMGLSRLIRQHVSPVLDGVIQLVNPGSLMMLKELNHLYRSQVGDQKGSHCAWR